MCMIYIYKITNCITNKVYIGQSKNPSIRWSQHKIESRKETPQMVINKSMKKHGVNNFIFEVIASCFDMGTANNSETLIIQQENSLIPNGYNVSMGGSNAPKTEQWKTMMSKKFKGRKCPYKATDESKEKNRISSLGRRGKISTYTYMGVRPCYNKWKAEIKHNRKNIFIGSFSSEIEAAKARDKKVYELYGNKAVLNFPINET